jgi:hypothetical protein
MKKKLLLLIAAATLLVGCRKEPPDEHACNITSFRTNDRTTWNIIGTNITYIYPKGTRVDSLTPTIGISNGATINPPSGVAQNFFTEQGVTYTVTAKDGVTTKTYTAKAAIMIDSGTTGDCFWILFGVSDNYTLLIGGNGAMYMGDDYYNPPPWSEYRNNIKTVIIQNGVTTVGDGAFIFCERLTTATIPNSVITIGIHAFSGCTNLTNVTIPNFVSAIGRCAFLRCSSLTSITIPNSVTTIDMVAFGDCSGLTSVIIGNSVTTIGYEAFRDCDRLTSITNLNPTPQIINSDVFTFVDINLIRLKVPTAAIEAYRAAEVWKDFGTIEGIEN